MPLYFIRLKLKTLERDMHYVVCCDTGRRSSAAATSCRSAAFDASVLKGGLTAYQDNVRQLRRRSGFSPTSYIVCVGFVAAERAGQVALDLPLGVAAILLAELHADAGGALALRALRRHPDHAPGDRQLLVLAHQVQQHEHLVAEAVVAVGRE